MDTMETPTRCRAGTPLHIVYSIVYRHPPVTLPALLYDRLQPSNMIPLIFSPFELPDHPARPVTHL